MKRRFILVGVLVVAVISVRYLASLPAKNSVTELLSKYNIVLSDLACDGGFMSRSGHCTFHAAPEDLAQLDAHLSADLSDRQPRYQNKMSRIGDGECNSSTLDVMSLTPRTQLGGGSLPYLGTLIIDKSSGHGCLEFEFGFG
jgi:hypothetical protein